MSAWFTFIWLIVTGPIACEDAGNNGILGLPCGVACIVIIGINIFESPEECSVKGTDVLGYLASMRDHFDGKKTTWWATYYKLENVTKNITKWNCTEKELAYYDKLAECAQKQLGLEETACELHARRSTGAGTGRQRGNWGNSLSMSKTEFRNLDSLQ
eukprot:symbB.v1.2.023076.t1/scaffold2054.1/size90980/1